MQPDGTRARRWRLALLGGGVLLALAVAVSLTTGDGGDGGAGRTDIGEQSDGAGIGRALEEALGRGEPTISSTARSTCEGETRATYGQELGALVYVATLRWRGQPAVARAYQVTSGRPTSLDHRVFVLSTPGCQLLVAQSM